MCFGWFRKKRKPIAIEEVQSIGGSDGDAVLSETPINNLVDETNLKSATCCALKISSDFEGNGDPFSNIVGNFDNMGLTAGALGWTWGLGDHQRLVQKFVLEFGRDLLYAYMPTLGDDYLYLVNQRPSDSFKEIATWSRGSKVLSPYIKELQSLWGSKEMIKIQTEESLEIGERALRYGIGWKQGEEEISWDDPILFSEFCFFFDVVVQNGSLKGLSYQIVSERIRTDGLTYVLSQILNWCASRDSSYAAWKDSRRNALHWKGVLENASLGQQKLFILAWLRSLKSYKKYQASVMNRKGIMALGSGYSEGELKVPNLKSFS